MPTNKPTAASGNVAVACIAVVFCFAIAGVVAVAYAIPEGANAGSLVTLMLGALATAVASMLAVAGVRSVEKKVDDLSNGLMDAKVRAAVADVLPDHLVDPAVAEQLRRDRARRDGAS